MSELTPEQIDALVLSAQDGDKNAFGHLYDHFFEKLYRYVYFRVNAGEVEDLLEDIFVKVWTKLEKYQKRDVSFGAWLYRVAYNSIVDHHRSHRSLAQIDPRMKDESREAAPEERTQSRMMAEKVREAVSQLREPYRRVVTLKFLMGLSNEEVAEIMGERVGNIRVIQFRALKQLKIALKEHDIQAEFL